MESRMTQCQAGHDKYCARICIAFAPLQDNKTVRAYFLRRWHDNSCMIMLISWDQDDRLWTDFFLEYAATCSKSSCIVENRRVRHVQVQSQSCTSGDRSRTKESELSDRAGADESNNGSSLQEENSAKSGEGSQKNGKITQPLSSETYLQARKYV